ncbi:MAG: hypothetical protein HYT83_01505 [Candidatus Levybacteria bacterium]|nr:hypothetical protein [Candidatus Levybacteria bacterium]
MNNIKILIILIASLISTSFIQIFNVRFFSPQEAGPSPSLSPIVSQKQETTIDKFQYPGSEVLEKDNATLYLESQDDAQKITDWYRQKIKSIGMNATFIQTKDDGNILNKLRGANLEKKIEVKILTQNNRSATKINVIITPSS